MATAMARKRYKFSADEVEDLLDGECCVRRASGQLPSDGADLIPSRHRFRVRFRRVATLVAVPEDDPCRRQSAHPVYRTCR